MSGDLPARLDRGLARAGGALARALEPAGGPRRGRLALALLGLATLAYAVTALWSTRGSQAQVDGIDWFVDALGGFDPGSLAMPHNDHPIILTRLIYAATLRLFGPEEVVIELTTIAAVAASSLVVFALLRKRVDAILAALPAILLMFLGSTTTPLDPNISAFPQSAALGLGAFLALEREDRRGDLIAFALLAVGVLTFSLGVAFALGAAVIILGSADRWRRLWIPAAALAVYAAWFAWARQFSDGVGEPTLANLGLVPAYAADSLAAAWAALSGLDREFVDPSGYGFFDLGWGRVLAVVFAGLCGRAALRGRLSARAWACATVLAVFWALAALAFVQDDNPQAVRYVWIGATLCVVIAFELLREVPMSRRVTIVLLAVLAFSLPANLLRMRDTGDVIRRVSAEQAAQFAAIELQRGRAPDDLRTNIDGVLGVPAAGYLELADRFGSLATPASELPAADESAREGADAILGQILMPKVVPLRRAPGRGCRPPLAGEIELPPGGAILRSRSGGAVKLRRFADVATVDAGELRAGRFARLDLPTDGSPQPWVASVAGAAEVEVCPSRSPG